MITDLQRIAESMAKTAAAAGVKMVTGDTKVVERGSADGVFINTTGIGVIPAEIDYNPGRIQAGDKVIVTGTMGDHGLAILAQREGLRFATPALSDCAALFGVGRALEKYRSEVKCMRDPTRGGLATVLNELAAQSSRGIIVDEKQIPVSSVVQGACDMLGLDPLYMANEGKMVIIASATACDEVIRDLHQLSEGAAAAVIGEVSEAPAGMVLIRTELGTQRILGVLEGEHVPRIC